MNIDRILIEYAKVQLQLVVANERIAQLEAQLKAQAPQATATEQN